MCDNDVFYIGSCNFNIAIPEEDPFLKRHIGSLLNKWNENYCAVRTLEIPGTKVCTIVAFSWGSHSRYSEKSNPCIKYIHNSANLAKMSKCGYSYCTASQLQEK
jgi:hypothetical protein